MTSRIVKVGRLLQAITTRYKPDETAKHGVHEYVTLETPKDLSASQRLRVLTAREMGRRFP
jgi:hypothetical protein